MHGVDPDTQLLLDRITQLEAENEAQRVKYWRCRRQPSKITGYALLLFGAMSSIASILYTSTLLTLIGLGLIFGGALLLYIRPDEYVKLSLLESSMLSSLKRLDELISGLNYAGKAVYLPPKYFKDPNDVKVFIPSRYSDNVSIQDLDTVFMNDPKGLLITPPGLDLANLYESELGTSFTTMELESLEGRLRKLFIEGLEIAEYFEMRTRDDVVAVKMENTVFKKICSEAKRLDSICESVGCPLLSSLAVVITRSIGRSVRIEREEVSHDGQTHELLFRLL